MPGGRRPRLPAIPSARATPPLREWPVLHFGVEVGIFKWCPGAESNHRHEDFQSTALPLSYPGMGERMAALVRIL